MDSDGTDSESTSHELVEVEEGSAKAAAAKEPDAEDSLDSSSESPSVVEARGPSPEGGCKKRDKEGRPRGPSPEGDKKRVRPVPAVEHRERGRSPAGDHRSNRRGRTPAVRRSPVRDRAPAVARSPVRDKRPMSPERPPSKGKSKGKSKDNRYVRCPHCWQQVVNTQCSQEQHQYWSVQCNAWQRYNRGATWPEALAGADRSKRRREARLLVGNHAGDGPAPVVRRGPRKAARKAEKEKKKADKKGKKKPRVSPSPSPKKPLGGKRRRPPSSDDETSPKERKSSSSKGWTKVWHWVKL